MRCIRSSIAWALADRRRLIAVLPFDDISRDGEGYFSAGMTEEVTNQLSKLSGLRVVSRTAVAAFKDARGELPRMVQELGVGSVVAGTVREDGTRVRVNVELIDARSGQVTWSEQYDREGVDVFAAQSDIALKVADVLNASVTLEERARVGKRPTSSLAAYELFVRARSARGKTPEERLKTSIDLLRQAIAIGPQFAEAYSEIANRTGFQAAYGVYRLSLAASKRLTRRSRLTRSSRRRTMRSRSISTSKGDFRRRWPRIARPSSSIPATPPAWSISASAK